MTGSEGHRWRVTGFHRRTPVPKPIHRCPGGSDKCGPRPHASSVTPDRAPPRCGGASRHAFPSASNDKVGGFSARSARSERSEWSNQAVQDTPRSPARGWLRGREWERITRGVYAAGVSRTQLEELAAWQLVLPRTAAFSHLTAAGLRGWWLRATMVHPVFAAMLDADPVLGGQGCWYAAIPSHSR
jgi:hypothetical protein